MIRAVLKIVVALVVVALAIVGGFRAAAALREGHPAGTPPNADISTVEADGLILSYSQWGPADGPPLLLVPGTLAWSQTFRDIAVPLAEAGHRVIAIDLPPFGYAQRPVDHDYSRKAQARRILAFADSLGIDRFALGVHSYGGGAALEAAFTAPGRIEAMVLLDVALGLGQPAAGPPLAPVLAVPPLRDAIVALTFSNPLVTGIGLRDFIHDDALVTPERVELYTRPLAVEHTTHAIGRWLLTGLFADESTSLAADKAHYRAFDRPVLIVWGREDTVTPLAQGEHIASLLPNADLAVLDGVNHIPHVEKPEEVVRLMLDFLAASRTSEGPDGTASHFTRMPWNLRL